MRIIIAGAGDVGTHLAKLLSLENQEIILVDANREKLGVLDANYNLMTLAGGPTSIKTLQAAETGKADLFIAVNLELLQLDNPQVEHTGIISYHKGDPRIGVEFPYNPSAEALYKYGFPANPCVLDIVTLDSHRLVLSSPVAVISCTRY